MQSVGDVFAVLPYLADERDSAQRIVERDVIADLFQINFGLRCEVRAHSLRAVELATERYNRGLSEYLNVVDAQRQFYDVQSQYAEAQISAANRFMLLYKSLGGVWPALEDIPAVHRPVKLAQIDSRSC